MEYQLEGHNTLASRRKVRIPYLKAINSIQQIDDTDIEKDRLIGDGIDDEYVQQQLPMNEYVQQQLPMNEYVQQQLPMNDDEYFLPQSRMNPVQRARIQEYKEKKQKMQPMMGGRRKSYRSRKSRRRSQRRRTHRY
jgi:hypothetical protein